MAEHETLHAPLDEIDTFINQSREAFDLGELHQLADDIKTRGQLQAGVAWFDPGRSRYLLICGERRYRALKLAGMPTMEVKVMRGTLNQSQMLAINLAENIQRASLNPIERGKAFRRLMQLEDVTAKEVAARTHVSDATVSRDVSLLELPASLQGLVAAGQLPASVGAMIVRLPDDDARRELADQYLGGKLNRDGVSQAVKARLDGDKPKAKPSRVTCHIDGITLSLSSGKALTWDSFNAALARIGEAAESLRKGGKKVSELSQALRVSG